MGLPVFKKCCCIELKWGALIVAILDILLLSLGVGYGSGWFWGTGFIVWVVVTLIHVAHIIACILVIIAVFMPNKNLVILYLITGILRLIIDIIWIIVICVIYDIGWFLITIIFLICGIVLGVYFWLVIYSFFRKLGGSTPAD